jgi:hypothetical protein
VPIALALVVPAAGVAAAPAATPAATPAASAAASSGGCGRGGTLTGAGNSWLAMQPAFTDAPGAPVTEFASPAFDPNLIWATDGGQVARTDDAGCTWTIAYSVPSAPGGLPLGGSHITALAAPSSANQSSFLYLAVTSSVGGVPQPQIVTTTDRGKTWSTTSAAGRSGLPVVGTVEDLSANPQVPQIAYALVDLGVGGVSQPAVYATSDGGATWTRRTGNTATAEAAGLRAHPLQTSTLFGLAGQRLDESSDGGTTFQSVGSLPGSIAGFDIAPGAGGARIAAALANVAAVALSRDDGKSWLTLPAPAQPISVAVAPLQDLVAVTDGNRMWFLTTARQTPPIGPNGSSPVALSLSAPTSAGFSVTGLRNGAILRAAFTLNLRPTPPPLVNGLPVPVYLLAPGPVTQFPATLTPATTSVRLTVGGHVRVPVRLLLPRTPTPVDVMFLVDTTSSMQPVIDGLRQGLAQMATSLDTSGLNARFGLGDFRDYPSPWGSSDVGDWPYRLDQRVSVAGSGLANALASMQATGGTTDGGQSALTALYQSTTGAGDLEEGQTFVAPGQQAGYRPDALKLAMVSTDTAPHYGAEPVQNQANPPATVADPGPGYDDVINAMRAHGVHEIGLVIDPGGGPNSRPALTRLAAATDSVAPRGGVDCNGDGIVDVPAGAPLVCTVGTESTTAVVGPTSTVTAASMAAAVVSLAANIPDMRPLRLQVSRGASYASIASGLRPVNLHADNEIAYGVDVTCPAHSAGRHPIELSAATPARTVATAAIDLTCVARPTLPALGAAVVTPLAGIAIAPAPPAPATNPVPNPQPNPNPNPNPAPNLNVNPAIADQEQRQEQLAFANAVTSPNSEDLAMSFAAATLMLAAASCVLVRRRRTVYAICDSLRI